ncbi:MAG: endo alpha-1,4 polygalactosaminidase [Actinomycetes bacterium]
MITATGKSPSRHGVRLVASLAAGGLLVGACATAAAATPVTPPPANAQFDYQLGGGYPPAAGVSVVARDRTDTPVPGMYNICYVNGFQTQPNEIRWWKRKHRSLLLRSGGRYVTDQAWGELLLDTSTLAKRRALSKIIGKWTTECARRGFAAVEFDNLDSQQRSGHRLTAAHNLALAKLLAERAHAVGLAVGQKNAAELSRRAKRVVGFDFAVTEECQQYSECDLYTAAYGDNVIEIEYTSQPTSVFAAACAARGDRISIILRDPNLRPAGRPGYAYAAC